MKNTIINKKPNAQRQLHEMVNFVVNLRLRLQEILSLTENN